MSYLWAGYAITWLAVAGFAWRLKRRAGRVARHLRALEDRPGDETLEPRRASPRSDREA